MALPPPIASASGIVPEPKRTGVELTVNGERYMHTGDPDMPLLWWLRDVLRLTGTKYGCGVGACGACTVLIDGKLARACLTPVTAARGRNVTTVEGLADPKGRLHPVQRAWIDEDVPQCGYCQAGQLLAAAELLARKSQPSDADIDAIPNLCRCGTYPRIRRAIRRAAAIVSGETQ